MGRSRGLMKYQIQEPPFSIEQILAGGMKEESGMARQFDEKYTTNELMMEFYERERPKMNLLSCPLDGMNAERQRLITGLREVLDIDKLKELLPGPLTYNKECEFVTFGVTTEKYCVNMADALNVPVYKLIPEQPNGRTVLYLHGHDNEGVMGAIMERYDKVRYHKNLPVLLAKEGFTVFAPELLGFGESDYLDFPEGKKPRGGCAAHVAFLTVCGYNLTGFRVFETMRVLDMMEQTGVDMPCIGFER